MSRGITLYLQTHEPWRIHEYTVFDMANNHDYFTPSPAADQDNESIFQQLAQKTYLPMNALLEKLLQRHPDFKLSIGVSGTFIEQAELFDTEVLESFKRLVATSRVELVAETYYHSLAFFYDQAEFAAQVAKHRQKIREIFGVEPVVFRNTEMAYTNDLAKWAEQAGFKGVLAEGWDPVLGWRSPNYVYRPAGLDDIKLLLNNYNLSNDLALRFGDRDWAEWPLTAEKYQSWLIEATNDAPLVNLFLNYKVFGEFQSAETGIFEFFEHFVDGWLRDKNRQFLTVSEAIDTNEPQDEISMPRVVSWSGANRDLAPWLGNEMQQESMNYIYEIAESVLATGDQEIIDDWRKLQTTDHFSYMSLANDAYKKLGPHYSPYDAFLYYLNIARDLSWRTEHRSDGGGDD